MKVITEHPIEVRSSACGCQYSGIDGSDTNSVTAFQKWVNTKKGARLKPDGLYGPNTKAAYAKFGAEWEKTQTNPFTEKEGGVSATDRAKQIADGAKLGLPANESTPENIAMAEYQKSQKPGIKEKIKSLPMPAKIAIGVVGLGLVGFIIYKILK